MKSLLYIGAVLNASALGLWLVNVLGTKDPVAFMLLVAHCIVQILIGLCFIKGGR